ncbi:MAG: ABC transporter permease [Bacillota bacterium]|nr:ABC transporter permease [Bacillota bacterium]
MAVLSYMWENSSRLLTLTGEQLTMALWGTFWAAALGIPIGIFIYRHPRWVEPILWVANAVQTIPALAFIGLGIIVFGLGRTTAIFILFAYGLMPIIRSTYTGLRQVDRGVGEATRGMGMTAWQQLFWVELPLAFPVMLVGLRVAAVVAIGTASIMSLGGAGGLGEEIFAGLARIQDKMIWAGSLLAMSLAILTDLLFLGLERLLTARRQGKITAS